MHIMEGFLPAEHAAGWTLAAAPFVIRSARAVKRKMEAHPQAKLLLGLAGAFVFLLSALKLPSVTGSSSHPTGIGLGAILFGPEVMTLLGAMVLLFQALLLAHGGLTTLGANAFAMAIVGPWAAWGVYRLSRWSGASLAVSTFLASALGDLATYITTSIELALAFPDPAGGFPGAVLKFTGVFAVTQIPLAVSEGLLTVLVMNQIVMYNRDELQDLAFLSDEA